MTSKTRCAISAVAAVLNIIGAIVLSEGAVFFIVPATAWGFSTGVYLTCHVLEDA